MGRCKNHPKSLRPFRDLLFDHVSGRGTGKTYDHHAYEAEMRQAVETWAAHVQQLVQPQGVALLR